MSSVISSPNVQDFCKYLKRERTRLSTSKFYSLVLLSFFTKLEKLRKFTYILKICTCRREEFDKIDKKSNFKNGRR